MSQEPDQSGVRTRIDQRGIKWTTIEHSIVIDRPIDQLEKALFNPANYPRFFPRTTVIAADDAFPQVGSRLHLSYHASGMTFDLRLSVTEEGPRHRVLSTEVRNVQFVGRTVLGGGFIWEWSAEGEGTRLLARCEYEVGRTRLAQRMERWMLRRFNIQTLERSLKNIKGFVESGQ